MTSLPFEGSWAAGCFEIRYIAKTAGQLELHLWCEAQDGSGREPLPGSPFPVLVSEGPPHPVGSFVKEAEASKQGSGIVAGEHVVLRPQVHDQYHNATSAPDGALTAVLDSPGNPGEILEPPKLRSGMGTYELILEPLKSGEHSVHIRLHGEEISGSPVSFYVSPAAPNSQKCYLSRPADAEPTLINQPCDILLTTHDKYGNQLDRGGVRVDAKAAGVAATACTVEDHKDGTYTIRLTAGAPGEVKVTARIDSVEIRTLSVFFVREREQVASGSDAKGSAAGEIKEGGGLDEELTEGPSAAPATAAAPTAPPTMLEEEIGAVPAMAPSPAAAAVKKVDKAAKAKAKPDRRMSVEGKDLAELAERVSEAAAEVVPAAATPAAAPAAEKAKKSPKEGAGKKPKKSPKDGGKGKKKSGEAA